MGLMNAIEVSASGLAAQRKRLEVLVSNLVNANTTSPPGTEPYRRKDVVFTATTPEPTFGVAFNEALGGVHGVTVSEVVNDTREPIPRHDPGHVNADKDGNVYYPNIDPLEEMVNMMSATRSYEANLQAVNNTKEMALKTIEILK